MMVVQNEEASSLMKVCWILLQVKIKGKKRNFRCCTGNRQLHVPG